MSKLISPRPSLSSAVALWLSVALACGTRSPSPNTNPTNEPAASGNGDEPSLTPSDEVTGHSTGARGGTSGNTPGGDTPGGKGSGGAPVKLASAAGLGTAPVPGRTAVPIIAESLKICSPAPKLKPKPEPDVKFSIERGWYSGAQTLTLTPRVEGAKISVAVGGALPSKAYSGPITVSDNGGVVTVRARATTDGVPGPLVTHTYVFRPDVGGAVVVMTDNDLTAPPDEEGERPITFEFIPSPKTCLVPVAEEAGTRTNMGGRSSGLSDKVYFRSEYGNGMLDADLFGDLHYGVRPTLHHDHLYLRSDHRDRTFLRNIMAHDALLAVGQLSPHGRFVDYFENGELHGTRYLLERPEGGFMESYTDVDKKQWIAVSGIDALGTSLDPINTYSTWTEVEHSVNVHSLVDFMLVQWQAGTRDYEPLVRNWRATGPVGLAGGAGSPLRWHFFNWDIDRGYENEHLTFGAPMELWKRIAQFPQARFIFQDRLQCAFFNGGPLTVAQMMERFNVRLTQLLTTSLLTENGADLSTEPPRLALELEPWLIARETLLFDTVFTEDMLPKKTAVVVSVAPNGMLTLTDPGGGNVYFRIDGGDPRTLEGTLDPAAIPYSGPVSLPPGLNQIIARSFNEGEPNVLSRFSPACDDPLKFNVTE